MDISTRSQILPTIARISPAVIVITTIIYTILARTYYSLYLLICILVISISNGVFKNLIFNPLYNISHKKELPILGIGKRPPNANSCGILLDGKIATSYGMPSGHSQIAWSVATYLLLKLFLDKYKIRSINLDSNSIAKLSLLSICIISIAVYISFSRVYIEGCHTTQQVILGGLLGVVCGCIFYFIEHNVINKFLHDN
jgi:membrane-associated phospholipid phosphatase